MIVSLPPWVNRSFAFILFALLGFLLRYAYAPYQFWWVAPLVLASFFALITRFGLAKLRILLIFAFQLSFELHLLWWSGIYVGMLPAVFLALSQAVLMTLPFLFWRSSAISSLPACWLIGEFLITHFPYGGFGWGRLGYIGSGPISLYSAGGVQLFSFTMLIFALALVSRKKMVIVLSLFLLLLGYLPSKIYTSTNENLNSIKVTYVQGNVPRMGLDFNKQRQAVLNNHVKATETVDSKTDLIVWPENASDVDPLIDPVRSDLVDLAYRMETPILIGGVSSQNSKILNISLLVRPNGIHDPVYVKRHLAPFAEYLPLRKIAEFISSDATRIHDMTAGTREVAFKVGESTISPIICFEILDDGLLKEKLHSNIWITQTNTATFGYSAEAEQQLQIIKVRAIEHARPIVAVSTTGPSAFIDERGSITLKSNKFEQSTATKLVYLSNSTTLADTLPWEWIVMVLSFLPLAIRQRTR